MGKLADLIQRASKPASAPLGIGSARAKADPTMVTVAVAGKDWAKATAAAFDSGAAAVLLTGNPKDADIKAAAEAAGNKPCGVVVTDGGSVASLAVVGIAFAVLDNSAPAAALQTEGLDFVLKVSEDISDIQLRTVEPLPVEALYLERPAATLTIGRQMELQRITGLARKPMLTAPATDVSRDDLLSLRDSGAILLAVDVSASGGPESIKKLQEQVEALPPRKQRGGERPSISLPARSQSTDSDEEDDEDEE
jgi:hypothetical protein